MKNWIIKVLKVHVYVVCAMEFEVVEECKVFLSNDNAWKERDRLIRIYGGANVCLISRGIEP